MLQIYKTPNNEDNNFISINGFGRPFSINFHNQHYYVTDMDLNTVFKISKNFDQYSFIYKNYGWTQTTSISELKKKRGKKDITRDDNVLSRSNF